MTYDELLRYRPANFDKFDPEFNQSGSAVAQVPGLGTVTFMSDGRIILNDSSSPSGETWLSKGTGGEVVREQQAKNNDSMFSQLAPVLAVGLGGPLLGGALQNMGSMGWTSGYDLAMGNTAGLGGSATGFSGLSGAGITDEMLLTGQVPAEAGIEAGLGMGEGVNAGWSGFADVAGVTAGGGALESLNSLAKSPAGTSAIRKILSGSGGMQDWLSLLGPAMSIYNGVEGLDRAKDMNNLISGDVGGALGQLSALGITSPSLSPLDSSRITSPTFSPVNSPGITAPSLSPVSSPGITPPTFASISLDPITGRPVDRSTQAAAAVAGADPWGASGGRALADEQLQALMRSPGSLLSDPGYQARMMGTDRVMAAQGQLGGGGGAVAAANASGDYYQQRLAALAALQNMGNPVGAWQLGLGQEQLGLAEGELGLRGQIANSGQTLDLGRLGVSQAQTNLSGQVAAANQGIQLGQLDTQRGQLGLDAQKAIANQGIQLGQLDLQQGQLGLDAQRAMANLGIQRDQLTTQRGQLDLDAQKANANLGVTKGQLGLDAAKLKLAAAGGANTLAGQSLASIGYGVTQATGGTTQMQQAQEFLRALRASGAAV